MNLTKQAFSQCPLCEAPIDQCRLLVAGDASRHPLYIPELPATMRWLQCASCTHVFTEDHWTAQGERLVFSAAHEFQLPGTQQTEFLRNQWSATVSRVAGLLSAARTRERVFAAGQSDQPVWLDIGFGNGGLVMTADEFGFTSIGVDVRTQAVERLRSLGYSAICADFADLQMDRPVDVLSMADVLEHLRDPRAALRKAMSMLAADGLLYVSCPNYSTSTWRQWENTNTNPYWGELEHYHNFSRRKLLEVLSQEGLVMIDYHVSSRYYSCMEIVARKAAAP